MKPLVKLLILLFFITAMPSLLYAPPGGAWNPGNTDPTVPINYDVVFLILGGLLYPILRKRTKDK